MMIKYIAFNPSDGTALLLLNRLFDAQGDTVSLETLTRELRTHRGFAETELLMSSQEERLRSAGYRTYQVIEGIVYRNPPSAGTTSD